MDKLTIEHFEPFLSITDPRLERKKLHNLFEILVIAICAILCGVDDWEHIAEFGRANEDWFKEFLELENGIPSADTFIRVFTLIDPEEYERSFIAWMQLLYKISEGEIVAIDGKAVKGTYDHDLRKTVLHLVSAFSTQNGLVLGQVATSEKSNEITAIPTLLDLLNLKGCIVTIDAAGCQKAIAKKIAEKEANYILALKGNQEQFHDDIKLFVDTNYEREFRIR